MITNEEKLEICKLYIDGESITSIKKKTSRSRPSIRKILREAGFDLKKGPTGAAGSAQHCDWPAVKVRLGITNHTDYRPELEQRLRDLKKGKLHLLIGITGLTRAGKSYLSLELARIIDPAFDIRNMVFDIDSFFDSVYSSAVRSMVLDDAENIASAGDWREDWVKYLHKIVATAAHRKVGDQEIPLSLIFTMPRWKDVAKKIRTLFHIVIEVVHRCPDHIHALIFDVKPSHDDPARRILLGSVSYRLDEYDEELIKRYEEASRTRRSMVDPTSREELESERVEEASEQKLAEAAPKPKKQEVIEAIPVHCEPEQNKANQAILRVETTRKRESLLVAINPLLDQAESCGEAANHVRVPLENLAREARATDDFWLMEKLCNYFEYEIRYNMEQALKNCQFEKRRQILLAPVREKIEMLAELQKNPGKDRARVLEVLERTGCGLPGNDGIFVGSDGHGYDAAICSPRDVVKQCASIITFRLNDLKAVEKRIKDAFCSWSLDAIENQCEQYDAQLKEIHRRYEVSQETWLWKNSW